MDTIDNIIIISTTTEKDKYFYGLGLESGVTLIPPKYEDVKFPIGDVFMFCQDGKWGLMSLGGDTLLTPEYDNIFSWNKEYIVVGEGKSYHYKCGVIDWKGNIVIPFEYAAIRLTEHHVFRCYSGAKYDWGRNHNIDYLQAEGNSYIWKNCNNEILSGPLNIWHGNQRIDYFDNWLILDNKILLNPNNELQGWVVDKELEYIRITPESTLITKDKRGKYGLRDLTGKV